MIKDLCIGFYFIISVFFIGYSYKLQDDVKSLENNLKLSKGYEKLYEGCLKKQDLISEALTDVCMQNYKDCYDVEKDKTVCFDTARRCTSTIITDDPLFE